MERVIDKYVGEICMLGSGDVVRVDHAQLETVIPSPGGAVLVRGEERSDVEEGPAVVAFAGRSRRVDE